MLLMLGFIETSCEMATTSLLNGNVAGRMSAGGWWGDASLFQGFGFRDRKYQNSKTMHKANPGCFRNDSGNVPKTSIVAKTPVLFPQNTV